MITAAGAVTDRRRLTASDDHAFSINCMVQQCLDEAISHNPGAASAGLFQDNRRNPTAHAPTM